MSHQKLGQHFLASRTHLDQIAEAVSSGRAPLIVEIGPGRGALTELLLPRADRVVAIELDRALASYLREKFAGAENLSIVEGDVLETDLGQWGTATIAGNLPYYITSPILEKIFALGIRMSHAVVLVQREVAERLVAKPGSRDYGYLTVETNLFCAPELLFRVPGAAFTPPPKVESAVVRLVPRAPESWDIRNQKSFLEFAGRAFRMKRKTLRNNLVPFYGRSIESRLEARLRAEQLSLNELVRLFHEIAP